ncbi:FkbM family methyltransferase [Patescibacteria group bacterium]|nr:FkbM family methyltransferase [Patescibacteria group bacterium]
MEKVKDYSENGEFKIAEAFFNLVPPKHHRLVDVGALGIEYSNTYNLLLSGWSGLLVEPNPLNVKKIKEQFKGLNFEVVECAAADKTAVMDLHLHEGSGHDSLLYFWDPKTRTDAIIRVKTFPLATILDLNGVPFNLDLLSIDTEGFDKIILTNLFLSSTYRPRLIITELTSWAGDNTLFLNSGYSLIKKTGNPEYGNLIFARGEDLPPGVFKL